MQWTIAEILFLAVVGLGVCAMIYNVLEKRRAKKKDEKAPGNGGSQPGRLFRKIIR